MRMKSKNPGFKGIIMIIIAVLISTAMMNPSPVNAAAISKGNVTLTVGDSSSLKTGTTGKVVWTSANKKIATVSAAGKVKGIKAGKTTVSVKIGKDTYKYAVNVKNADAAAIINSKWDGDFYSDKTDCRITFSLDKKSTDVILSIMNDSNIVVYSKTFNTINAKKENLLVWNGTDKNGNLLEEGYYKISVTAGTIKTDTNEFKIYVNCPFAGGTGSKENPYLISSAEQFKLVAMYNGRYFKQTSDLDFGDSVVKSLFTSDVPFTGYYDGNNKSLFNLNLSSSLFTALGTNGTLVNMNLVNATLNTDSAYIGILVRTNSGTVERCSITDGFISGNGATGLLAGDNEGLIKSCTTSGTVKSTWDYNYIASGGITGINGKTGRIILSNSSAAVLDSISTYNNSYYTGGISAVNDGSIENCTVSGEISSKDNKNSGGISGRNNSKIKNCSYTGGSSIELVGYNSGVIE